MSLRYQCFPENIRIFLKQQKQPPEELSKKNALKNFALFTRKHLCLSFFDVFWVNFIKKRLKHRYFPVNIRKFLRTPILNNIWERLHLKQLSQRTLVSNCVCISSFMKVIYKHVMKKIQSTCVKKWSTFSEKKCLRFNIIFKINKLLGYYNIKITNGFFGQYLQKGLKQNKRTSTSIFTYSN